jgi:transcriptional regulator with XRE-family HTH domain
MPTTINERIAEVIKTRKQTQAAFARRLNVSQAYISKLLKAGNPSDSTVADICREYGINEHWLRTGEGAMDAANKDAAEISAFIGEVLGSEHDDFRRKLISVLARLDPQHWVLLKDMAEQLLEEMQEEAAAAEEQKENPDP